MNLWQAVVRRFRHAGFDTVAVLLAIAWGAQWRVWRIQNTIDYPGSEPASRALFARRLANEGWRAAYDQTVWGPLHLWVLAWSEALVSDVVSAARAPGAIASLLAVWPAYLVARRTAALLGAPRPLARAIGAVGAAGLAVEPAGIAFAALSFAEPLALPLILAAAAALLPAVPGAEPRWQRALLPLAMGCALRYEVVAFVALLPVLLPRRLPWPLRGGLVAAVVAPTAVWVVSRPQVFAQHNFTQGSLRDALPRVTPERVEAIVTLLRELTFWTMPALLPVGGLALLFAVRRTAVPLAAGGATLAFVAASALVGHIPLMERYLVLPLAVLALAPPLLAAAVPHALRWPALAATAALLLLQTAWIPAKLAARPYAAPAGLDTASQLVGAAWAAEPQRRVIVDAGIDIGPYVLWRAGIPPSAWGRLFHWAAPESDLRAYFESVARRAEPAVLLVGQGGVAGDALQIPPEHCGAIARLNARLRCVGRAGDFRVFTLDPGLK